MSRIGKRRQVAMTVRVFSGVCRTVSESNLIELVPSQLAKKVADTFGLRGFDPPMDIEPALTIGIWYKRADSAPMAAWMRSRAFNLSKALDVATVSASVQIG